MDHHTLWKTALGELELQMPGASFSTWLKESSLVDTHEGVALIALPNNFIKEWVENKYDKAVLGSIRSLDDSIKQVRFVVKMDAEAQQRKLLMKERQRKQLSFAELRVDPETNLNPKYTFASFVVGSSNELAHAACVAVTKAVGTKYNPLFIYGGVGLGKTHLVQSAGNEIKTQYENAVRVKYVSSEQFTNEVIGGIRNRRMDDVRQKYRNVDVLIIDDIQFIGGKEKTEEEFFHTFNALYGNNKQIILSSDRPPGSIPTLEERLRSRFEGGMIVDITYPDYETRVAIIKTKLQEKGSYLPDNIVNLIASSVKRNIREVEGVINNLFFQSEMKKLDLTEKTVEGIIKNIIQKPSQNIDPAAILAAVAEHCNVSLEDLTGRSRKKEVVEPRQIAMFLLRDMLELSYPHIGDMLGKRDHTTAIHAFEKTSREINKNQATNQKVLALKEIIHKNNVSV
ncbi:MAG: chromosomal replication initiator protein DnaA [Candidatus Liptonbacteria bacterium]|nr:chromosomal replication initiator protein DnaA [Candidatus Liptonbacteria bacterium]